MDAYLTVSAKYLGKYNSGFVYSYENPVEEGSDDLDVGEDFVRLDIADESLEDDPEGFASHATFLSNEDFSVLTVDVDELLVIEEDIDDGFKDECSVVCGEDSDSLPFKQDPPILPITVSYMMSSDMFNVLERIHTWSRWERYTEESFPRRISYILTPNTKHSNVRG